MLELSYRHENKSFTYVRIVFSVRRQLLQIISLFMYNVVDRKRPDLYKCSMCWKDSSTLLIGYGNEVRICEIVQRDRHDVRELPSKFGQICK